MCHERWLRNREKQDEESREVWLDFERTTPTPIADPEPPAKEPEEGDVEVVEELTPVDS
jgi:hypothetical protein